MPQTLLLVDDSLTIQRVIQLTFADHDIQVLTAGTVEQAIETIAVTPPDIVLADVGMPGQNGFDLARHLRGTPAGSQIPVLLLTGAFEPVDPNRARAVGANGVLVKPFEPAVVVHRVRELLAGATTPAVPAPAVIPDSVASPALRVVDPVGPRSEKVARLDDYFARLDEAIASRVEAQSLGTVVAVPPVEASDDVDGAPAADAGVALSGAFSALLAAEQRGADAEEAFDGWLAPSAPAAPAVLSTANVSDELVETIVKRVMERLPDSVVRDAVSAIANATAERVIREEIDRLKNDIP